MTPDELQRYAHLRTVAHRVLSVKMIEAADGVVAKRLPHGWHEIKAYDSEVYYRDGDLASLDTDTADEIRAGGSEWYLAYSGHDQVTVQCASGGYCRIVQRSRG
mgnify:CR=1 FL=1